MAGPGRFLASANGALLGLTAGFDQPTVGPSELARPSTAWRRGPTRMAVERGA